MRLQTLNLNKDTLLSPRSHAVREGGGSYPGRGTIVVGDLYPTRQLVGLSPPNMQSIVNSKFI